jgi:ubiquinone/menaquinone biosynthesis C-methylase UbiE
MTHDTVNDVKYTSLATARAVAILIACTTASADSPRDATLPPAPLRYMGREIAQTMHYLGAPWLVRESREREEDCSRLMKSLDLERGQFVCDMGCGNGFYTLKLAQQVGPQGKVLAVDIQPEMLELLRERAAARGINNITSVLGTAIDPQLPAASLDLILLVDVYHEFSHPAQMLAAMHASLKPGGRLALVEFRAEDPEVPIKPLHKMSQAQMLRELTAGGYKLVGQFDELPWQHVMYFSRRDSPLPVVELAPWSGPEETTGPPAPEGSGSGAVRAAAGSSIDRYP